MKTPATRQILFESVEPMASYWIVLKEWLNSEADKFLDIVVDWTQYMLSRLLVDEIGTKPLVPKKETLVLAV